MRRISTSAAAQSIRQGRIGRRRDHQGRLHVLRRREAARTGAAGRRDADRGIAFGERIGLQQLDHGLGDPDGIEQQRNAERLRRGFQAQQVILQPERLAAIGAQGLEQPVGQGEAAIGGIDPREIGGTIAPFR